MASSSKNSTSNATKHEQTRLAWILSVGGLLGIIAAFVLTLEKIALIKDPAHQLSCSLNPVLSCGPIIGSEQASAFGFPNTLIGLVSFGVIVTIGMALFAGAQFKRWFWLGLQGGVIFGLLFVHWLAYESLYDLNALCLYCMLVWSVVLPIFWYTTLYNLRTGIIAVPTSLKRTVTFAQQHHLDILIGWYLLFVVAILVRFWDYWQTLL
jgi:uncharacterized membrane protein